jgi:hypothetical protein
MVTATNKHTGEVVELPTDTPEDVVLGWQIAQEYAKTADTLKAQLKELVPGIVGERTTSDPINGFMFRISSIQRRTYDKSIMRQVLDEDTFDQLLKPDKTLVDKFLADNLETLGEASTRLRETMVEDGKPYQVIKLERLEREN